MTLQSPEPYSTFLPMLLRCMTLTRGAVLELGCGWYSTPALHYFCEKAGRPLVSAESDAAWAETLKIFRSESHQIEVVDDWARYARIDDEAWDVVLVDHVPRERRPLEVARLANNPNVRYVVLHDAEDGTCKIVGTKVVETTFRHTFVDRLVAPWTAVFSNIHDLTGW